MAKSGQIDDSLADGFMSGTFRSKYAVNLLVDYFNCSAHIAALMLLAKEGMHALSI
jgi:hypothetical protein